MDGVIIIDKPQDFTSFDVVAKMKKLLHTKKVGHAGTLDPMATGVLPILIGRATKAQDILPNQTKGYEAEFKLGIQTDTLDITGKIIGTSEVTSTRQDIENILPKFRGDIEQIPPMYSALKKDGVRLYDLARQGVEIERKARPITIEKLELLEYNDVQHTAKISVTCSKGTYIRSLCDDIGKTLGCGATMTKLRRTEACSFNENVAITLDKVEQLSLNNEVEAYIQPIESLFMCYEAVKVSPAQSRRFQNGNPLDINRVRVLKSTSGIIRINSDTGEFLGLGKIEADEIKMYKLFKCIE